MAKLLVMKPPLARINCRNPGLAGLAMVALAR